MELSVEEIWGFLNSVIRANEVYTFNQFSKLNNNNSSII